MSEVLVLYYSRSGSTKKMAHLIARGIEHDTGTVAKVRTVPDINSHYNLDTSESSETPYVTIDDIQNCDGLALGSPTRFGNMAAPMKHFLDELGSIWFNGSLVGKPACVFTSTGSMHGGQESTLITMMLPLLHQGMLLLGIPYTEEILNNTMSGGTPYGASHLAGRDNSFHISEEEKKLCLALGKRLSEAARKLKK